MSFSSDCKTDIVKTRRKDCCALSFLYGVMIFSSGFSTEKISVSMPDRQTMEEFINTYKELGYSMEETEVSETRRSSVFTITSKDTIDRLYFDFGYTGEEPGIRINRSNFMCDECRAAFIGGAFVSSGSVTDPRSGYHLEISNHRSGLFSDLMEVLSEAGFAPRKVMRGYSKVAYFKESGAIEDLLTFMGASDGAMKLMDLKIYKEIVNNVNRRMNCESANIGKTIASATADIEDITYIKSIKGEGYLSGDLAEIARLRVENPELSLTELGSLSGAKLTKSGVSHRLSKIRAEAKRLREEQNNGN